MRVKNYLWMGALCVFTSCVDDKYDLGKIDTDNVALGDEWVIPLGTLDVKVTDVIDLDQEKIEGLEIAENGDYSMSYAENLSIPFPDIPLIPGGVGTVDIAGYIPLADFNVGELNNMMGNFGSDFRLGLANPYITLVAGGLKGNGTVDATLSMAATKNGQSTVSINSSFQLSEAKPKVWIGPWPATDASYTYVKNEELPNLIVGLPDRVSIRATQFLIPVGEVTDMESLAYVLELPFIPSEEFRATATQTMKDIFDEDFIKYVFSSGTTTIFGTITNQLPIDAIITMSITDVEGKSLLELPEQSVKGRGAQPVSFEIKEKDMPKMQNARNIQLQFALSGRPQDDTDQMGKGYLNKNQTMKMELKLRKTGGINVEL